MTLPQWISQDNLNKAHQEFELFRGMGSLWIRRGRVVIKARKTGALHNYKLSAFKRFGLFSISRSLLGPGKPWFSWFNNLKRCPLIQKQIHDFLV